MLRRLSPLLWPLLAGVVILLLWYGLTDLVWQGRRGYLLPRPHEIPVALWRERAEMLPSAFRTAYGALVGFLGAVAGGFVLALILASARWVRLCLHPWVLVLQMIPVVILAPIFTIWLGAGMPSVAAITFMISFFPVVANTTHGLVSTDRGLLDLFALSGASRWQEIFLLRLPSALPSFLTGVRIAATLAPIGAITSDLLSGTASTYSGLGFLVQIYRSRLQTDNLYAVAFLACVLGFLFVGSVNLIHSRLGRAWQIKS